MYNKTIMVGRLTRDIELRYLPSGAAIAKSSIATSHSYKTQDGQKKEESCFLDFNIFGRTAEVANQYIRKGSKVLLEGRLVLEQWTAQDGSNRSKHSLRVDNMTMLDSKADSAALGEQGGNQEAAQNKYKAPSQNNYGEQSNVENNQKKQVDEDEIPF